MKKLSLPFKKWTWTTRVGLVLLFLFGLALFFKVGTAQTSTRRVATFKADVGSSTQVIVVRAANNFTSDATLEAQEFDAKTKTWKTVVGPLKAKIGSKGFSANHQEGDQTSPQGVFTLTEAFGTQPKPTPYNFTTYRRIDNNSWWVSDPESPLYNTPQVGPANGRWREYLGEHMTDSKFTTAYRYGVVIDYNRETRTPYAGSAIFLHVGSKATSGCIAIDESELLRIMRWLNPNKSPKIVMGTDSWLLDPEKPPAVAGTAPVGLQILPPDRILDTRNGIGVRAGKVGAKSVTPLVIRGRAGVPADATVVALNVTVTEPDLATFLTVSPGEGAGTPNASNVNVHAGDSRAAMVLARIGANGSIQIYNDAGNTHLVADVVAYGSPNVIGGFQAEKPTRVLDTRQGIGMADSSSRTPIGPAGLLDLPLRGVPINATAVVMNVTSTDATRATFLSAYAGGQSRPETSTLNVRPRQDTANLAIVPLGGGNTVRFYNSAGDTHLVADVLGYLLSDRGDRFVPIDQPTRVVDTRTGVGYRGQIGGVANIEFSVAGMATNTTAVVFNLTGVNAAAPTYFEAYPSDAGLGKTSSVNLAKSEASANLVVLQRGTGSFDVGIHNNGDAADAIVDVTGWFVRG